jgi:hypothetical protein
VVEGEAVAREGELVLGAALDVFPGEGRDAPRRYPAQLLDRERAPEVAAGVVTALDGRLSP